MGSYVVHLDVNVNHQVKLYITLFISDRRLYRTQRKSAILMTKSLECEDHLEGGVELINVNLFILSLLLALNHHPTFVCTTENKLKA